MAKGKQTCKILKEIRKQIAAENDIELVISECTYQGDCLGTCPKCEAEVRYLERELEKRQRMGKAAVFAGMSLGAALTAASCGPLVQPLAGMPANPNNTVITDTTQCNHSPERPLAGDVVMTLPDTLVADTLPEPQLLEGEPPIPIEQVTPSMDSVSDSVYVTPEVGYVVPFGQESDPENDIYMIVEQMPEFLGGYEAMMQYVADHVNYPEVAKKAGCQGRVYVGFIVEPDGSLSEFKVLRGIGYGCDEEAMRVAQSMPKWNPGTQRGKAVRVSYLIPVIFQLEDK